MITVGKVSMNIDVQEDKVMPLYVVALQFKSNKQVIHSTPALKCTYFKV